MNNLIRRINTYKRGTGLGNVKIGELLDKNVVFSANNNELVLLIFALLENLQ